MIDASTADQLDALGRVIFNPQTELGGGTNATGLQGPDSATDAQYLALIAPVMLAIDGRVMEQGFRYTLNETCALMGRPKHWFMELNEYNTANPNVSSLWPCQCGLLCVPNTPTGFSWSANSYGYTIGLATCAAICHAWAIIVRLWLAGNYPLAVAQPAP